jgi:hypothetical protein
MKVPQSHAGARVMNASQPDRVRSSWTKIIACLEAQHLRIHAEITG